MIFEFPPSFLRSVLIFKNVYCFSFKYPIEIAYKGASLRISTLDLEYIHQPFSEHFIKVLLLRLEN